MTITRDNYEPFFLDYLEGKLEENLIDEFLDFLEQNPDLKEELHLFENIHLPEEQIVFAGKEHLYKSAVEENAAFEIKSIALLEGDLREEERQSFEVYLVSHPELEKEYELFQKTRLVADAGIKYPDKQRLYRKSGMIILMNWVARAAAVVLILWGTYSLFQTGSQTNGPSSNQEIALVKPQPVPSAKKIESTVNIQGPETGEKIASKTEPKPQSIRNQINRNPKTTPAAEYAISVERDLTLIEEINPIMASLERNPIETQLAVTHSLKIEKINDSRNIMTLEEYLASRAKKMGDDGLLSANRLIRTGLNVASELSGDRIGYKVKNGKISSLDFESKLMAFSIPLQKK